ncbi:hypothetical protein AB0K60_10840 [Thermopolyspora sp. NPDC052614]|uniref:hypothetical protein n=1 Tax=Thermopolyspora sp. NPDC052614 TaxID=3155682 RepID=UPI00342B52F4
MPRLHSLVAGFAALNVLLVLPMHPHPSGSTDRVTPGAVRVEATSRVSITLHDDRSIIRRVEREYETLIAEGSGFTVTPDGAVVTATGVVKSDRDARVYAANRVFAEYFKVKIPADYSRHRLKDPDLNARLQRCYPPVEENSICEATVTTKVTVFPYTIAENSDGLPAEVLQSGSSPSSAAVLKITEDVDGLPTVPLATKLDSKVESIDFMTLPDRPSAKKPPVLTAAHLEPPGSGTFRKSETEKIDKALKGDGDGAAVIDDGKSEIIGLVTGGGDEPVILTPVEDIHNALVAADVTPRRGQVDVVYETALASYHNKNYTNAIPVLQQVLRLRGDHAVAADHLRVAQSKRGTAEDTGAKGAQPSAAPQRTSSASPWLWVTGGVVVAGLLVAVLVPMMLRRRRERAQEDLGGPTPPDAMQISSWPPQPTEMLEYAQSAEIGLQGANLPPQQGAPLGAPAYPGDLPHPAVPHPRPTEVPVGGTQTMRFCTQCGMRLGHAHRFCGFCGHPVESP